MEYEVYLACNVIGAIVVVLIFVYHMIAAEPIKSLAPEEINGDVNLVTKRKY